jgi:signal transduction histidine kinase
VQRAIDERVTARTAPGRTVSGERRDGTTIPIALIAKPFLIGMEMRGVVVTFRDMTEERKIDMMKTEFISLASHQLRTPLTAIGWYVELLEKDIEHVLSLEQKDYITQIVDSHRRMVDLVNALLNVSRIELGRLKIDPEETDVRALVDATVRELTPQIQVKKLRFRARLPRALTALIDARLVQIVLENILSNAVKYTPAGGSVELTLIASPEEMLFEVQDTGYGIPKSQEHRIFEKLFRADNILKTDTVGTGLGLYIAKFSVEAWGGRLWFESKEGQGSVFHFTVPLKMRRTEAR